jgi:hypothetical protein
MVEAVIEISPLEAHLTKERIVGIEVKREFVYPLQNALEELSLVCALAPPTSNVA